MDVNKGVPQLEYLNNWVTSFTFNLFCVGAEDLVGDSRSPGHPSVHDMGKILMLHSNYKSIQLRDTSSVLVSMERVTIEQYTALQLSPSKRLTRKEKESESRSGLISYLQEQKEICRQRNQYKDKTSRRCPKASEIWSQISTKSGERN